jgi:molecular chaperone DnaK (HSP70)
VPAYFDDAQRQATRTAGRLAGLDVVRIVPEPTAAALAYGIGLARDAARNRREVSHVAVYDFGGGTFDVSILRLTPADSESATDFYQVLATSGDTHLGGDDVDQLLVREFIERWISSLNVSSEVAATMRLENRVAQGEAEFVEALMREARGVKHALADREVATFSMPGSEGAFTFTWELSRREFDALIEPIVARTLAKCEQAVRDARVKGLPAGALNEVLDAVILVGGSTRIRCVRSRVREFFGVEPYTAIDPDEAIALGASVQASILSGATKGSLLLDVIPLSLGIETVGGAVAKLIVRNTAVPTKATEFFSTSVDNQTAIRLSVYQGEREMAADCRKLGEFHLRGLPPMPAGLPQVQVQFLIDANGVLNVTAGKRAELQVVPNHGLTNEEVERIERESVKHAKRDMQQHRVVDLITNSSLDLKWIGDRLAKFESLIEPAYASELRGHIATLQDLVTKAKADWQQVDANAFQRAKETLDRASVRLQEISIAQSLKSQ